MLHFGLFASSWLISYISFYGAIERITVIFDISVQRVEPGLTQRYQRINRLYYLRRIFQRLASYISRKI